jgi:hypothetical protein
MIISYKIEAVVLVLEFYEVTNSAEVVAQMQMAGWADTT